MKNISFVSALAKVFFYPFYSLKRQERIQKNRLRALVLYAKKNSPYFAELYKHIGDDFALLDLPPVSKLKMMEHYDDIVTDRNVKLKRILNFISDMNNLNKRLNDQYMVCSTSGSTGEPAIIAYDLYMMHILAALGMLRMANNGKDFFKICKRPSIAGITADGGFFLGNGFIRQNVGRLRKPDKYMRMVDSLDSVEEMVRKLNEFMPTVIDSYPGTLEILADEAERGHLKIAPVLIIVSGELLKQDVRARLKQVFHCTVKTVYGSSEGGTMAQECRYEHLHINTDWIILEPVDENNQPVPPGTLSNKVLLTNLSNYIQPFIRYEITDRVKLHTEPCPCGNKHIWLDIEGRNNDSFCFQRGGTLIRVDSITLYVLIKSIDEIKRHQLILHHCPEAGKDVIEARLLVEDGVDKEAVFEKAVKALEAYFFSKGIDGIEYTLSDKAPQRDPRSGKLKMTIEMKE